MKGLDQSFRNAHFGLCNLYLRCLISPPSTFTNFIFLRSPNALSPSFSPSLCVLMAALILSIYVNIDLSLALL